jgi:hypothetical protein
LTRRLAVATAVLLGVTALIGCASSDIPNQQADVAGDYSGEVTVQPGTDPLAEGARSDVDEVSCEEDSGTWVAAGRVSNRTSNLRDYRIYVSFVDADGDTRAVRQADVVSLEPGEQQRWQTSAPLADATQVRCVLRVERTVAA